MINKIKKYVDKEFGIDISKRSNKNEYTFGRAIFFRLCTDYCNCSTQKMADVVGLKRSSSVSKSRNNVFPYVISLQEYKESYLKLEDLCRGVKETPRARIRLLEQEVDMLRQEVDRLRRLEFVK